MARSGGENTESQKAFDLLDERFPQSNSQGAEARLVFQAPDGQRVTAREHKAAVEDTLGSLDGGDQVASTTDPYETGAVSEDGTIAYSTITYTADAVDLTGSTKSALEDAAEPGPGRGADRGDRRLGPGRGSGAGRYDGDRSASRWRRWCWSSPSGRWSRPDCRC